MSLPKFLLFGDSITQFSHSQRGFALAPALQDLYQRKMDVVTRGFSGYNTAWALPVFREVVASLDPVAIMYVFLGTNDAATTFQAVPVEQYRANLREMVALAVSRRIRVVVVGPGLHDQKRNKQIRPDLAEPFSSSAATRVYADAARSVAHEFSLPFVDLWSAFQRYGNWSDAELLDNSANLGDLLLDGIHYSPAGYKVFYDELTKAVFDAYPEMHPDKLKTLFPLYSDIDLDNPGKCIMDSSK